MATHRHREMMAESAPNRNMNRSESEEELGGEKDEGRGELSKKGKEENQSNRILNRKEDETEVEDDQIRKLKKKRRMEKEEANSKVTMKEGDNCSGAAGGSSSNNGLVLRRERLLPKMALRILLVEADDSTRQIIAVLLRKCSYRVAAVADGLKAWELLKERPHNIDLILTEFDLPSISGYALLTLIMGHELCKNIPVIMMSKEDSIGTVYKCMVRGAADYLVKPVRRNELRNLWQHVWRRHIQLSRDNIPQDESVGQERAEAASETNAASNHSTGNVACVQKNKEYAEKGSDSQSSCTKPDVEAEGSGNGKEFLQQSGVKSFLDETKDARCEAFTDANQRLLVVENEVRGSNTDEGKDLDARTLYKDIRAETERTRPDINAEARDSNGANFNREGIDFMGEDLLPKGAAENIESNFDSNLDLDPSLKISHSGQLEIQVTEERHKLRRSTTSAFTPYIAKPMHSQQSTASVCNQKELGIDSDRNFPTVTGGTSASPSPSQSPCVQRTTSLPIYRAKESKFGSLGPPPQTPAYDTRIGDSNTGHGSMFPPFLPRQSAATQLASPCTASHSGAPAKMNHQPKFVNGSNQLYDRPGTSDSTNTTWHKQDGRLQSTGHVPQVTYQNGNSIFGKAGVNHVNNMGCGSTCGSMGNADQGVEESKNEGGVFSRIRNSSRWSLQREAALNKFCLKRKERCFEKKVRYESRKKLAEQRPRVKGQFVRKAAVEGSAALEGE